MKLSLQMSQTTASAHQHNPVALLAELVELLQSSIHDKAGCLRSAISGVVLVKRKKKSTAEQRRHRLWLQGLWDGRRPFCGRDNVFCAQLISRVCSACFCSNVREHADRVRWKVPGTFCSCCQHVLLPYNGASKHSQ